MLIATGAAVVLLTIVWKPALLRFAWNASGSVVGFSQTANIDEQIAGVRLHCNQLRAAGLAIVRTKTS